MIELANIEVQKAGIRILNVSHLQIKKNEKLIVHGPNGSGKTTLLKVLAGLEKDVQGQLEIHFDRMESTYVHQEPIMFRGKVRDNLMFGLNCRGISAKESTRRIEQCSAGLNFSHLIDHDARKLSGGEKKKVAIVRALVVQPRLLLIDEPLSELDEDASNQLIGLLLELESTTVVITSPDWDDRFKSFRRVTMKELAMEEVDKLDS